MRIAVFHNFLDNIGGAEIVALTLTRELKADLYTTSLDLEKVAKMGFSDLNTRIHSLGRLPKKAPYRQQLALWKFRRLNLSGKYDFFIIAGDWAMSAAVNHHPNLWYVHSPLNELFAFVDFIKQQVLPAWQRPVYGLWVIFNRYLTRRYARSVDSWACNSLNTKQRIAKAYQAEAEVIYPPVKTGFTPQLAGDYWLSVNRLITHKRVELQLEAFASLPGKRLIIVGSYEKGALQFESYKQKLEDIRPSNVEIRHWISDHELQELYAHARGFIATACDEDFGLTVVEAMAHGCPVIAPAEGGYLESVVPGETGIIIEDINAHKIREAILEIEERLKSNPDFYRNNCLKRAQSFSVDSFIEKIKKICQKV